MSSSDNITAEHVREITSYDPETGIFRWRWRDDYPLRWNVRYPGTIAGTTLPVGYVSINFNQVRYYAHRLAWLFMTGHWPTKQIDHINGIRHDNRFSNLREATNMENQMNRKLSATGTKGICWYKQRQRWRAYITVKKQQTHLGFYDTKEEAAAAYTEAARKHYGDFART